MRGAVSTRLSQQWQRNLMRVIPLHFNDCHSFSFIVIHPLLRDFMTHRGATEFASQLKSKNSYTRLCNDFFVEDLQIAECVVKKLLVMTSTIVFFFAFTVYL